MYYNTRYIYTFVFIVTKTQKIFEGSEFQICENKFLQNEFNMADNVEQYDTQYLY